MKTKNREILEKIAELMAHLPGDELLKPDLTSDQTAEWHKCRRVQFLLSEEWRCRYIFENHRYPIEEACDRGEITKAKARLYLSMIVETDRRWKLVQTAEPLLRGEFDLLDTSIHSANFKYPFNSDFDFFAHILKEEADSAFSCCLEPYLEMSSKRYSKILGDILEFNSFEERSPQLCLEYLKKIKNNFKLTFRLIEKGVAQ